MCSQAGCPGIPSQAGETDAGMYDWPLTAARLTSSPQRLLRADHHGSGMAGDATRTITIGQRQLGPERTRVIQVDRLARHDGREIDLEQHSAQSVSNLGRRSMRGDDLRSRLTRSVLVAETFNVARLESQVRRARAAARGHALRVAPL